MKLLDKIIRSPKGFGGFEMKQVQETESGYVYEQINTDRQETVGFHAFERRENTMYDCESYPGGEAFGNWAWQFTNKQDAVNQLEVINQIVEIRNEKLKSM